MAIFAVLIGATLIGLYSWSIDTYQPAIADCKENIVYVLAKICKYTTIYVITVA